MITLTIDGRQISVPDGTLLIRAAEAIGIEIPRFCEHPYLDPVAACRQCLVEVEGQRKLFTACSTPVAEGMQVRTQHTSDEAKKSQEGMLELLLINHPLDCPVCDRGGECPLQDQALAWGPGESRYIDPKRVFQKPIPMSPLVLLDRERCVLCTRCTRFGDEISGERFLEMFDRGPAQRVAIAPGEDLASPFSGNTVQICPVGALTSTSYRFAARPFDVRSGDSICGHCASGCTLRVDTRRGEVIRHLARDNDDVNDAWLCDKGRYAFRYPDRDRLQTPMLRAPGLEPASYAEVFGAIRERTANGARVAFLGGGRLTDEDSYAMSKLARTVFGTNDLDHRTHDAPPSEAERIGAAGMPVTYADVERAKTIFVVGLDAREELPILHLRIRKAVRRNGAKVFVVHPRRTALADVAEHLPSLPGAEAALLAEIGSSRATTTPVGRVAQALRDAGGDAVILAGPWLLETGALDAAAALAAKTGARFAGLPRRAGDRGALRAGVHPRLLPGGRAIATDRAEVEAVWGSVPAEPGRGTREILEAAARREIDVLFLVGVDVLTDFPDADLARRALENAGFCVVVDVSLGATARYADAALPAAALIEKSGHLSDWEGRAQRLTQVRPPIGLARAEWRIFQELSEVMGADLGFDSLEALQREMAGLMAPRELPGITAGSAPETASPDDGLLLFSYPLLVDEGILSVDADELKAALGQEASLEVHPADAETLGLSDGGRARVKTGAGEAVLPVRVSDGIAQGAVFVPWNQPGLRANTLFSAGVRLTQAVVEGAE